MPPALPHLRIWFFYSTIGDVSHREVNSVTRGLSEFRIHGNSGRALSHRLKGRDRFSIFREPSREDPAKSTENAN